MSEDPTKNLPEENSKVSTTQPMLEAILARMNEGFAEINARIDAVEKKVDDGFAEVNARIDAVEKKVDEGFAAVNARIDAVEKKVDDGFAETNARIDAVEKELKEQNKLFKGLERRFDIFTIEAAKVKGEIYDHLVRIEDLELKAS